MNIIFLKGLPGSGKTTFAKKLISHDKSFIRINKDDIRMMLFGQEHSTQNEKLVLNIRNDIIKNALNKGYNIVIDDTNFNPIHYDKIKKIATQYNSKIHIKLIDTPLDVCIKRDSKRNNPVGINAIKCMYNQYLKDK